MPNPDRIIITMQLGCMTHVSDSPNTQRESPRLATTSLLGVSTCRQRMWHQPVITPCMML